MAKQAIDDGKIGKIVAMSSRRNIPAAWTPEILNKIGPIVGDAIHDTDLMLWFTGDRVASAYAQTVSVRGLKFPDIGQTMYRFRGGATATLETVWCMPEKTPFDIDERMSIIGTEGIIHIQDTFPNLGIVSADKLHSPDTTYWPMFDGVRGGALREEFGYFADCALKGKTPAIGRPEDAAAALEATLAAEESARTGIGCQNRRLGGFQGVFPMAKKRVLVVGLGNMGMSHALAYTRIPDFEVVGVCERRIAKRRFAGGAQGRQEIRQFRQGAGRAEAGCRLDQHAARHPCRTSRSRRWRPARMSSSRSRWPTTCRERREGGGDRQAHRQEAGDRLYPASASVLDASSSRSRASLGTPLVFRMNLNQQSNGETWDWHKRLMDSFPPIVDCGVHYVDVMCQMTKAKPVKVHAIGAQLTDEVQAATTTACCRCSSMTARSAGTRPAGAR